MPRSPCRLTILVASAASLRLAIDGAPFSFAARPPPSRPRSSGFATGGQRMLRPRECGRPAATRQQAMASMPGQSPAGVKEFLKKLGTTGANQLRKLGPQALEKLADYYAERASGNWPAQVKLDFIEADGNKKDTLVWSPYEEYLHDVFGKYGARIQDFELKYKDDDDDEITLHPSKKGVEQMLESVVEKKLRITVYWRAPTLAERAGSMAEGAAQEASAHVRDAIEKAKLWICGGLNTADAQRDAASAEEEVQKHGGRIVPSRCNGALVRYEGVDLDKWTEVCENFKNELQLSADELAMLKNAAFTDKTETFVFRDTPNGSSISTRVVAYRTVRDTAANKIHVVYGRHESTMEATAHAAFPLNNCIKLGGRTFTVLPPASPHFNHLGTEMIGKTFELPAGWKPVEMGGEDFEQILKDVIKRYFWGVGEIVVQNKERWFRFRSQMGGTAAGAHIGECSFFSLTGDGRHGKFTGIGRLLVEAMPQTSPELVNNWKRYVQLSAQAEWAGRLGLTAATP